MGSVFELHWLSCSMAYGILVARAEIEPASPALQGRFLTTGPPGKFPCWIFRTQINSTHFPSKVWNPTENFLKSAIDSNRDQNNSVSTFQGQLETMTGSLACLPIPLPLLNGIYLQATEAEKALVGLLYRKTAYCLGTGRIHNRTTGRRQCLELPLHQSHHQNKPLLHLGRKESGKKNWSLVPKSSEKAYFCGRNWRNLPPLASLIVTTFGLLKASLVAQTVKRLPAMWETRVQSLGWEDSLEKEMAAHSSTPVWKIPWTEEPSRLQSMGSQRVGHNWATSLSL